MDGTAHLQSALDDKGVGEIKISQRSPERLENSLFIISILRYKSRIYFRFPLSK